MSLLNPWGIFGSDDANAAPTVTPPPAGMSRLSVDYANQQEVLQQQYDAGIAKYKQLVKDGANNADITATTDSLIKIAEALVAPAIKAGQKAQADAESLPVAVMEKLVADGVAPKAVAEALFKYKGVKIDTEVKVDSYETQLGLTDAEIHNADGTIKSPAEIVKLSAAKGITVSAAKAQTAATIINAFAQATVNTQEANAASFDSEKLFKELKVGFNPGQGQRSLQDAQQDPKYADIVKSITGQAPNDKINNQIQALYKTKFENFVSTFDEKRWMEDNGIQDAAALQKVLRDKVISVNGQEVPLHLPADLVLKMLKIEQDNVDLQTRQQTLIEQTAKADAAPAVNAAQKLEGLRNIARLQTECDTSAILTPFLTGFVGNMGLGAAGDALIQSLQANNRNLDLVREGLREYRSDQMFAEPHFNFSVAGNGDTLDQRELDGLERYRKSVEAAHAGGDGKPALLKIFYHDSDNPRTAKIAQVLKAGFAKDGFKVDIETDPEQPPAEGQKQRTGPGGIRITDATPTSMPSVH